MKITKIEIKDFRAFPGPGVYAFNLEGGKNLLVYGENGSGKSSLYQALVEFFNLNAAAKPFADYKNIFSGTITDGRVTIDLSDGTPASLSWNYGGSRATSDVRVVDASLRKGFLEYRSLLRTSFVEGSLERNLFALAVNTLMHNIPVTLSGKTERPLGEFWDDVVANKPQRHGKWRLELVDNALKDFNSALQAVAPDVEKQAAEILDNFEGHGIGLKLNFDKIRYDVDSRTFVGDNLNLSVTFNGQPLADHASFLNEARLSAIALSIYLASILLGNPAVPPGVQQPLKLLVLDDVLIGLDLSNRLPLLSILERFFPDYQVFLFTFDKVWYEMVSLQTAISKRWVYHELFTERLGGELFERPIHKTQEGLLVKAKRHLGEHDENAAALYTRAAFEMKLKRYCDKNGVWLRFRLDPRRLNTAELLDAVELDIKKKGLWANHGSAIERIKMFRKVVLNPLSHGGAATIAKIEIQGAIEAVEALQLEDNEQIALARAIEIDAKASLATKDLQEMAAQLRAAFHAALRDFCKKKHALIPYRDDFGKLSDGELWEAAKIILSTSGIPSAPVFISDIEARLLLFLDDLSFADMDKLGAADLKAALVTLRDPAATTIPQTKFELFAAAIT